MWLSTFEDVPIGDVTLHRLMWLKPAASSLGKLRESHQVERVWDWRLLKPSHQTQADACNFDKWPEAVEKCVKSAVVCAYCAIDLRQECYWNAIGIYGMSRYVFEPGQGRFDVIIVDRTDMGTTAGRTPPDWFATRNRYESFIFSYLFSYHFNPFLL